MSCGIGPPAGILCNNVVISLSTLQTYNKARSDDGGGGGDGEEDVVVRYYW
jgi:hypothetical protein